MKVIKRNGVEVSFGINKIKTAIGKASYSTSRPDSETMTEEDINSIAEDVEDEIDSLGSTTVEVETIQNIVETQIFKHGFVATGKDYIKYRYEHELARKGSNFDDKILTIIDGKNEVAKQENSNKNPTIISTQRDYMAGEISRDLVTKYFMDPDLIAAHNDGLIHIHDTDYISQKIHNCFTGGTKFVTNYGIRRFKDFVDGASVYVKDLHGVLRLATVHNYGKQRFNEVTLKSGKREKTVRCTPNHRWVLLDGTVTTSLNVGDKLWLTEDSTNFNICSYEQAMAWCMGFIVGDGCDHANATQVRLCGPKNKYKPIFEMAGFSVSEKFDNGDVIMCHFNASKQSFLNGFGWRYMHPEYQALAFKGLYCADGSTNANKIVTSDNRVCCFIEETSGLAGYYISSSRDYIHSTNFKENAYLKEYYFSKCTPVNLGWTVVGIKSLSLVGDAWCVEEPVTHTFTLEGGVVTGNCDVINLKDMLENGTVISGTLIERPKSFSTACNITTQIVAQVASSQLGGQTFTLTHLAPFVDVSRKKIKAELEAECEESGTVLTEEQKNKMIELRLKKEIKTGVQMIQYQIVTLMTTNGQAPFVSVFMYLNEAKDPQTKHDLALIIEEMLKQRYTGVKNEKGVWVTPAFPKLLYVLEPDNTVEGTEYWYLTELAAKCTAKRLVPDYISEKKMFELKEGNCYPCMGCRSFLTPWKNANGEYQFYGRFNQGVVTINLVDVACSSGKDMDKFWKIFDERLDLCYRALMRRHQRLLGTVSDVAPILWQFGALARLKKGETIDKLLLNGYSTISLGYAGLYECTMYMTGASHTGDGKEFALKVMQHLNDACAKWKKETTIGFSVYGTPLESTTYKFAKCLKKRFGEIKDVTDHDYITNSYHCSVREKINAFDKLTFESEFQNLSPGGAISYVEVPNMQNNIPAVLALLKHIYDNIMYAELNTKSDYCQECGFDGEIKIVEDKDGKLIWKCPNCGNTDQNKLNVARRTCGLTNL